MIGTLEASEGKLKAPSLAQAADWHVDQQGRTQVLAERSHLRHDEHIRTWLLTPLLGGGILMTMIDRSRRYCSHIAWISQNQPELKASDTEIGLLYVQDLTPLTAVLQPLHSRP